MVALGIGFLYVRTDSIEVNSAFSLVILRLRYGMITIEKTNWIIVIHYIGHLCEIIDI